MGRRKNSLTNFSSDIFFPYHEAQSMEALYPTLHKIINSDEMHLFDLASVQSELERMLSTVIERLECLSAESKGKEIPETIVNLLKQRGGMTLGDSNQSSFGRPSLIVTPNPDKPLSLIISQQTRPTQPSLPAPEPSSSRKKFPPTSPSVFRVRRSSTDVHAEQGSSNSPDKNQLSSSYAIPNKFWELMEPYCAEITEANINYLESLIRSYQDMESTLLQPPSLHHSEAADYFTHSPAPKRPKRDGTLSAPHPITEDADQTRNEIIPPPQIAQNLCFLENELRKPPNEACGLGKLSRSLLSSCYQEHVVFSFTESVRHFSEESKAADDATKPHDQSDDGSAVCSSNTSEIFRVAETDSNRDSTFEANGVLQGSCSAFPVLTEEMRRSITSKACQPIKALAKQMHVTSSYRVEKKISQAMDELGLIPLKINNPPESKNSDDFFEWILHSKSRSNLHSTGKDQLNTHRCPTVQSFSPSGNPTDTSTTLRFSSVKRRRGSSGRYLRSPVCNTKDSSEVPECNSHRSSIKLEDADYPSANGTGESSHSDRNLRKSIRQTGCTRTLRSHQQELSLSNGGDPLVELSADSPHNSHVTSPKHIREPLVNGICYATDDDELDATTAHDPGRFGLDAKRARAETPSSPGLNYIQLSHELDSDIHSANPSIKTLNSTTHFNSEVFTFDNLVNGMDGDTDDVRTAPPGAHTSEPNNSDGVQDPMDNCSHASKPITEDSSRLPCTSSEKPSEHKFDNAFYFLLREIGAAPDCAHKTVNQQSTLFNSSSSPVPIDSVSDEVALAIQQRQQELRLVCAENHAVLRRLVQAARRDMQRQEIQRRLAIADADVIEAYNKLESYRPQRKPPLKRDRDSAYKALKERRKILKELEAFDAKSP